MKTQQTTFEPLPACDGSALAVVQAWTRIAAGIKVNHGFGYWGCPRAMLGDVISLSIIVSLNGHEGQLTSKEKEDYQEPLVEESWDNEIKMPVRATAIKAAVGCIYAHARALEARRQDDVDGPLARALRRSARALMDWQNVSDQTPAALDSADTTARSSRLSASDLFVPSSTSD